MPLDVTEGGKIFIGSSEYLLGIMETLYSDTQDESILSIKAELFEDINDLEEAREMICTILETQNFDYPLVKMYQCELKALNNKIGGQKLLDERNEVRKKDKQI